MRKRNANLRKQQAEAQKEDIAPVKTEDRSWFKSGAFEDGYNFGDITKTVTGTATDITQDVFAGILGIGEKTVDTGAYLLGKGAKIVTGSDRTSERMKKFIKKDLVDEEKLSNRMANYTPQGIVNNILTGNLAPLNPKNMFDVDKTATETFEGNSVLGEKTDSLMQSAGQLAGTFGLQFAGVPWWLTSGATAFGGEAEQAFKKGATYNEAGASALISAGAEILTEKISGGISFGGKTLDKGAKELVSNLIANKTVQNLTKFGMDVVGEGAEEVLTEVINNVGKKLTYEDEKTWKEILASEEAMDAYLESFIGGAVLGGGINTPKIIDSVKNGTDYDTSLTAEDVQAQIAEKEAELAQSQDQREQQIIQDELDVLQEEASNIPVKDERTQSEKMTESKKEAKQIVDEIERNLELEQQAETEQEQQQIRDRINELETQLAPLQEQLEESNSNTYANEIAELERIRGNISNETIQKFIDDKINSLKQDSRVEEQTTPASQEVVEQASAESLQTTTDEVIENNPLNVDENTPISNDIAVSEDTTDVTKRIKDTFGLKPKETKELYDRVAKANSVEQTRKILEDYKDIKETVKDDRVKEAREYIRSIKKDVNSFKHNVTDYKDFYRKNGRKLNIGNDGMSFDTFYQELSSQFPEYFDSDVLTLEDQLEIVTDFMNNNQEKYSQTIYEFNDAELNSLAEELYTDVHAKEFEKGTDYKKSLKDLDSVVDQEALKEEIIGEVKNQVNSITSELAELKKMLKDTVTTIQETKPIEAQALQKPTEDTNKTDLTESKTRDENSNLEKYYHGTRGDFEKFDNSKIGQNYEGNWSILGRGFYFTKNYDEAKEFGASSINEGDVNVKEGFLDIKNPFYASKMTTVADILKFTKTHRRHKQNRFNRK